MEQSKYYFSIIEESVYRKEKSNEIVIKIF